MDATEGSGRNTSIQSTTLSLARVAFPRTHTRTPFFLTVSFQRPVTASGALPPCPCSLTLPWGPTRMQPAISLGRGPAVAGGGAPAAAGRCASSRQRRRLVSQFQNFRSSSFLMGVVCTGKRREALPCLTSVAVSQRGKLQSVEASAIYWSCSRAAPVDLRAHSHSRRSSLDRRAVQSSEGVA